MLNLPIVEQSKGILATFGEENEVFVLLNNRMMRQFPNDDVVLLNNDVEVTDGCLSALQTAAYMDAKYGIAGAKILYPRQR